MDHQVYGIYRLDVPKKKKTFRRVRPPKIENESLGLVQLYTRTKLQSTYGTKKKRVRRSIQNLRCYTRTYNCTTYKRAGFSKKRNIHLAFGRSQKLKNIRFVIDPAHMHMTPRARDTYRSRDYWRASWSSRNLGILRDSWGGATSTRYLIGKYLSVVKSA